MKRKPSEWVSAAEKITQKHGKLPTANWLQKNGYNGLADAIRHNPALFAHVRQSRTGRSRFAAVIGFFSNLFTRLRVA